MLLLVDDVPWLDRASVETLRVVLRRIGPDPVAAVLAARAGEPCLLDAAGLPELVLAGLDVAEAGALLPGLAPDVLERLVEGTGGNPLALEEIAAMLTPAQSAGSEPLPEPLPAGDGIAGAFRRRLDGLPAATGRALAAAAACQRDDPAMLWRAFELLGLDEAALRPAEESGAIALERGRLVWRHPLLRAAAYGRVRAPERRRAHRALADACSDGALDERAWHLAAGAARPDEEVAAELERAALDARRRGGVDAAAQAFAKAAELSVEDEARARRLLEAADDLRVAGRFESARALLDEAARTTRDPVLAADVGLVRGVLEMWCGDSEHAISLLLSESERVELLDPVRAARLLIEVSLAVQMSGRVPSMLSVARRAQVLAAAEGGSQARRAADLVLNGLVLAGEAPPAAVLREELRARAASVSFREENMHVAAVVLHMLVWVEEHELARRIFTREIDAARASGALGLLPFLDACLGELEFRAGRFARALEACRRSVRLAEEVEQLNVLAFSLVSLARVEAGLGRTHDCRAHTARALELGHMLGSGSIEVYALSVQGLLELGLGHGEEARDRLERLAALVEELGLREPGVVHWRADLVEAQILAGAEDAARASLAVLEEEAARTGRAWAAGTAARCRGMLAGESFERELAEALRLLGEFPFERARTQLRLGERLRRSRRAAEARVPLRAALQTFEVLGAAPWAARAAAELRAAGARAGRGAAAAARAGRGAAAAAAALTPQELQVALRVARGATNREAATSLFLSPKTIEFHLGNAYRKLNVRSRAELARLLVGDGFDRAADQPTSAAQSP